MSTLSATCPDHGRQRFTYRSLVDLYICPGDSGCQWVVYMEDVLTKPDGGDVVRWGSRNHD